MGFSLQLICCKFDHLLIMWKEQFVPSLLQMFCFFHYQFVQCDWVWSLMGCIDWKNGWCRISEISPSTKCTHLPTSTNPHLIFIQPCRTWPQSEPQPNSHASHGPRFSLITLRWQVNSFTISYLPCIKCLILLVCNHLQPNLIIKYYMASTICVTNLDTMLQKIVRRAVVEFYNFSVRFTRMVREPHTLFLARRKFNSR